MSDYDFDPDDLTPQKPEKKEKPPVSKNTERYTDQYDNGAQDFPRHDTPSPVSAFFAGVKQRWEEKKEASRARKMQTEQRKRDVLKNAQDEQDRQQLLKDVEQSHYELEQASKDLEKMALLSPEELQKIGEQNMERAKQERAEKLLQKQLKIQKKEGLRAPSTPELDGHLNMPELKSKFYTPPNTKIYGAIVVALVLVAGVYFLKDKVNISFAPNTAPTTSAPVAPPDLPEAPVEQVPEDIVDPIAVAKGIADPVEPAPPTTLPPLPDGEYTNVVVPKDAVFEKPMSQNSIQSAPRSAPIVVKPKKTAEQLQEEEERRVVEEQMKKLDAWNK